MNRSKLVGVLLVAILANSCSSPNLAQTEAIPLTQAILTIPSTAIATAREDANISFDFFDGRVSINNDSNVSAKNLKVWLCIAQVSKNWQDVVADISDLKLTVNTGSLGFSQEYLAQRTCTKGTNEHGDSVLYEFETLPANQNFNIVIDRFEPTEKLTQTTYEGKLFIKTTPALLGNYEGFQIESAVFSRYSDSLIYQLEKRWAILDLQLKIECDNCLPSEETFNVAFRENINIAGCEILSQNDAYIFESCLFWFLYSLPEESEEFFPQQENRYFIATQNNMKYNALVEISEEEFQENMP